MCSVSVNNNDIIRAYGAAQSVWKRWLQFSIMCKPVVTSRTFADVVKHNAYIQNCSEQMKLPLV